MIKIIEKKLSEIIPYNKNPRRNDRAIEAVMMSIKNYGFTVPIIIDQHGIIIAGHTRHAAAIRLGMDKVPTIQRTDLTPEQVKAFRIADNKVAELSAWDNDLLRGEFQELIDKEYDVLDTGFRQYEIDKILAEAEEGEEIPEIEPADIEETVKAGEVWKLGDHRLICGDSTDSKNYDKLLGQNQVDLLFTDPPYGVSYGEGTERGETIANDDLTGKGLEAFLFDVFIQAANRMKDGAAFYVFYASKSNREFENALERAGLSTAQQLIWTKTGGFVLNRSDYKWAHEPILYGWKPTGPHYFAEIFTEPTIMGLKAAKFLKAMTKKELLKFINDELRNIYDSTTIQREPKPSTSDIHPTQKPVPLCLRMIRNSTIPGGRVLDPFSGSGSTLLACEQTERICYAMELDTGYCSAIIKRWEDFTGKKAENCDAK